MTPTELVETFLAAMGRTGGFGEAIGHYFTDATVYENVGMTRTTGIAEGLALAGEFEKMFGPFAIKVDMLAIATQGTTVLTERIDHIVGAGGETLVSIRIMGIFETADDRITGWRDYFDTASMPTPG